MSQAGKLIDAVATNATPLVEVFVKTGRSRSASLELGEGSSQLREERGWAVRAGSKDSSVFVCGTGMVPTARELERRWPPAGGTGLRLPPARRPAAIDAASSAPPGIEAPLLGETESLALLAAVASGLDAEAPGARLVRADLDDGYAEVEISSSRGVRACYRSRVASLRLWARRGDHQARIETADRQARRLSSTSLARRLADRLSLAAATGSADRRRGPILLAPEVAASILSSLESLFVGESCWPTMTRLLASDSNPCSEVVSLVDDGAHAGGVFEAPADGEGVPTRRVSLIDCGRIVQPLLPWWQAEQGIPSGCCLRPSFRQPPRPGATHLFLEPAPGQAASALLTGLDRGYYFIETLRPAVVDLVADRFEVSVCGFDIERGRVKSSVRSARLVGSVSGLFAGIEAVGRDLRFVTSRGSYGSPSLLVTGLLVEP